MSACLDKIKGFLAELNLPVVHEDTDDELVIVDDEESGIKDLIIDCEDPVLIIEQLIMPVPEGSSMEFYRSLLQMNGTLVHGAFVLDEEGKHVFFRDTLQLENLDRNELEASIRALSLALAEYADDLIALSK